VGEKVEVLASYGGKPVAIRQESVYGTTFHPELSGNTVFHEDSVRFPSKSLLTFGV
jgi:5'-phosphate synthase pdxT subunit